MYPVIFIDCIHVKIRDGQVANRPIYVALAVTVDGTRDILGLWAGEHGDGEGAKYWLRVLTEIKNRGTQDVCIMVCDGLKGLPDAVTAVWPQTLVQTCIVHLLRNSFRYASRADWAAIAKDLKPVYTAPSEQAALDRFAGCGPTPGRSSCRFCSSTPRSVESSAPPMPSSRSTPGSAGQSTPAATSRMSRPGGFNWPAQHRVDCCLVLRVAARVLRRGCASLGVCEAGC